MDAVWQIVIGIALTLIGGLATIVLWFVQREITNLAQEIKEMRAENATKVTVADHRASMNQIWIDVKAHSDRVTKLEIELLYLQKEVTRLADALAQKEVIA